MKKAKSTIEGGEQWSCARYFLVQPHNRRSDIQITCSRKHTQKSVDNIRHDAHTPRMCALHDRPMLGAQPSAPVLLHSLLQRRREKPVNET